MQNFIIRPALFTLMDRWAKLVVYGTLAMLIAILLILVIGSTGPHEVAAVMGAAGR